MKAIRILLTNIDESFKGVFRNFSLSLASISCIAITLVLVGFSIILSFNVNNFTKEIEGDLNIVVFLKRKATTDQIAFVQEKIDMLSNIKEVKFNSRENVKSSMQKESDVFNSVLSEYTEDTNPLQDTFLVKVENINKIGETADELKKIENVDVVKYGEGSVEELVKIFDLVKRVTYIIVIGLVIVTCFLISNTIKLTIFSRRNEIEIMRLVGASNITIKLPFLFEGFIIGLIGSIIPVCITIYGYVILYSRMHGKLFSNMIMLIKPYPFVFWVSLIVIAIGALVGMYGSIKAVRKYLKV